MTTENGRTDFLMKLPPCLNKGCRGILYMNFSVITCKDGSYLGIHNIYCNTCDFKKENIFDLKCEEV